jgi:DNA-binding transcriptional ArsR family regulator
MSATLAALSDDTRRAILVRLKDGPASVRELAEPFRMSQQAISKHLAYLERARLIEKHRDGRQQICRLNAKPMQEVATWVEQYRQYWDEAFGRLDALLHELHPPKQRSPKPR